MVNGRCIMNKSRPTQLSAIDLFAGAGGATRGLRDAGYRVIAAVENDHTAAETYRSNHPSVLTWEQDIRNLIPFDIREHLKLKRGQLSLLSACPPCQGFSTLGTRDKGDPRNDLLFTVLPFIDEFHPKCVIIENVPGLYRDVRIHRFINEISLLGYKSRAYLVDAVSFGVPQRRYRLILLGTIASNDTAFPESLTDALPSRFDSSLQKAGQWLAKAGAV